MRFVSSYSLQQGARGLPRILEFQVIRGEEGKGVRLVVNEQPYTGPRSAGFFVLGPERFRPMLAGIIGAAANVGFALIAIIGLFFSVTVHSWRWAAACPRQPEAR